MQSRMGMRTWAFCLIGAIRLMAGSSSQLPDGSQFKFWEEPLRFSRTYYVDGAAANADDDGPGSKERPFRSIGKASQILQPGERVVIAGGVYRESVRPARGGTGPDRMISYEAAPGAKVIVKGSSVLKNGWEPSEGWYVGPPKSTPAKIWQVKLDGSLFEGYNPFGMVNVIHDRYWLNYKSVNMSPFFRRRGMVFVDGKPLEQVEMYRELVEEARHSLSAYSDVKSEPLYSEIGGAKGKWWVEHNGLTLHVRLPDDDNPDRHVIEITTKEQVFAPEQRYLGYIRVKGITFAHAGNGFPVPQRGLVSTNRGHHWIIEDNTLEWANSVALDVGNEDWNASRDGKYGYHVIRNNIIRYAGIEGIAGPLTQDLLIEGNLVEWVGWQNTQRMFESSGIKFHSARGMLFRNNVIRHMRHASAIWLDVYNLNCRLTSNVFTDVISHDTAIHIEGSHNQNQIDNNIIWDIRRSEPGRGGSGIFIQGTDRLIVAQNVIGKVENNCVTSDAVADRLILGRGGTARENRVFNNLFVDCGKAAIEFANEHNQADGNVYAGMPEGFLRIANPPPQQWLDLPAWREFHGMDKNGAMAEWSGSFDAARLRLTLTGKGDLAKTPIFNGIDTDFFGTQTGPARIAGPFGGLGTGFREKLVDPRPLLPARMVDGGAR